MKNCTDCKYADWKKNAVGNLHPSGDGCCTYPYKIPPLPASMQWIGKDDLFTKEYPIALKRVINRRAELKEHCVYFVLCVRSK